MARRGDCCRIALVRIKRGGARAAARPELAARTLRVRPRGRSRVRPPLGPPLLAYSNYGKSASRGLSRSRLGIPRFWGQEHGVLKRVE